MHRILYLILAASLLPLCAYAKLNNGLYFQAIATDQTIANSLWFIADGKKREIYATQTLRSSEYPYDASPTITFYGNRLNAQGEPIPEAIVNVPNGATRLLLLFSKLAAPDERGLNYRVFAMKDDVNNFPFGSFRFINTSQETVAIDLQGNQFMLAREKSNTLTVPPPERGDLSIKVAAYNEEGQWQPSYTNGWSHRINLRTLAFIVDGQNGRVKILRYRQTEPMQ